MLNSRSVSLCWCRDNKHIRKRKQSRTSDEPTVNNITSTFTNNSSYVYSTITICSYLETTMTCNDTHSQIYLHVTHVQRVWVSFLQFLRNINTQMYWAGFSHQRPPLALVCRDLWLFIICQLWCYNCSCIHPPQHNPSITFLTSSTTCFTFKYFLPNSVTQRMRSVHFKSCYRDGSSFFFL